MKKNRPQLLVVDLDGTILRSDMIYESFWSAFALNWRIPFLIAKYLKRGKAALKDFLCSSSKIEISNLPYDEEVIAYIYNHRKHGGRVALVTASNQNFADAIAKHLKIFDEVYGSDSLRNLKGINKANFLTERFGHNTFYYMGDAYADLSVWEVSQKIITVNASNFLRKKAEGLNKPITHLNTSTKSIYPFINTLRPHQWLKNILIFLPMIAAHQIDLSTFNTSLIVFVAFSLVASSVYILNDLLDLNADRAHPRKRTRPFASGAIPIKYGFSMMISLLFGGMFVGAFLGWTFLLTLGTYYLLTTAYSLILKRRVVLDICVLAGLYTIRIISGGVATGIELSVWLLAFSIFFFLSLASVKRQAELVDMTKRGILTSKGRGYHIKDLPIISMIGMASGYISVLVMALYLNSPVVQKLYTFPYALWGVCCVLLYWLTRTVLITHRGSMDDDPVIFAVKDKVSQFCFVIILSLGTIGVLL